jgi:hypothetical protein
MIPNYISPLEFYDRNIEFVDDLFLLFGSGDDRLSKINISGEIHLMNKSDEVIVRNFIEGKSEYFLCYNNFENVLKEKYSDLDISLIRKIVKNYIIEIYNIKPIKPLRIISYSRKFNI